MGGASVDGQTLGGRPGTVDALVALRDGRMLESASERWSERRGEREDDGHGEALVEGHGPLQPSAHATRRGRTEPRLDRRPELHPRRLARALVAVRGPVGVRLQRHVRAKARRAPDEVRLYRLPLTLRDGA